MTSFESEYKMGFTSLSSTCKQTNDSLKIDVPVDSIASTIDVQLKTPDDLIDVKESKFNCTSDTDCNDVNSRHNAVVIDDDVNPIKLCANCLKNCDTENEECFEKDDCCHLLCIKCRFLQDNVCKICKTTPETTNTSTALDLSTGYIQNLNDSFSNDSPEGSVKNLTPKKPSTRKVQKYVLPNYIEELPCNQQNEKSYRCTICRKVFFYKLQAKYHEACFTGERPLKCDLCSKTFIKKSHLEYHLRCHSGNKPFKCDICNKAFVQRNKLNRHMTIHSDTIKPFKCEICDRTLCSKERLEQHLRIHSGERPFNCKQCRRRYSTKSGLKKHELRHSGTKNFVCEECGKRFLQKTNLSLHKKWHLDVRPHSCSKCGRAFVLRKDLMRHMQIHTDAERDYECSICIMAFRRKDNLERHMKNIHPETITKYGRPQHIVSVVKVDNNIQLDTNKSAVVKQTEGSASTISDPQKCSSDVDVNKPVNKESKDNIQSRSDNLESTLGNPKTDFDNVENDSVKTSIPKCQKVSVISSTKNYMDNISKTPKNVRPSGNINKKTETIAPYRLIKPPVKPPDSKDGNCVPTITRVTHIVHTSNTGVSNIKTLITTRNIPDKSTKKVKEKRLSESEPCETKNENKPIGKQHGGVIKYVSRSNNKNNTKYKCYRVLQNNNNQSFTTLSSRNICSNDVNNSNDTSIMQPLGIPEDSTLSESVASVQNILYNGDTYSNSFQPHLNILGVSSDDNSKINMVDDCCNINVNNNIYNSDVESTYNRLPVQSESMYSINKMYDASDINLNKNLPPYSNVSESCLLADNVLDDSITASLYMDEENNSQINNTYKTSQETFINDRNMLDQVCTLNYSLSLSNDVCDDHNGKESFHSMSGMQEQINYNCLNNIVEKVGVSDETNNREPYIMEQPSCYNFENNSNFSECNAQELTTINTVDFERSSSMNIRDLIKNTDCSNVSPNAGSEQRTCESNGLFTLANMACARANLQHPP